MTDSDREDIESLEDEIREALLPGAVDGNTKRPHRAPPTSAAMGLAREAIYRVANVQTDAMINWSVSQIWARALIGVR